MFTHIAEDVFTHLADDPREEVGLGRAFPSRDRRKSKLLVTALAVIGHKESPKGSARVAMEAKRARMTTEVKRARQTTMTVVDTVIYQ